MYNCTVYNQRGLLPRSLTQLHYSMSLLLPPPPPEAPPPTLEDAAFGLVPFSVVCLCIASVFGLFVLLLLGFLLHTARNDKPVRTTGLGFLVYLLLGALCGQAYLVVHAEQIYQVGLARDDSFQSTWTQCHAQGTLLVLHLAFYIAPLSAKLWRVFFKIRTAETHRLQLWDVQARKIAAVQLLLNAVVQVAHLIYAANDGVKGARQDCLSGGEAENVERALYILEVFVTVAAILPAPILISWVTGSSYAPIFASWST